MSTTICFLGLRKYNPCVAQSRTGEKFKMAISTASTAGCSCAVDPADVALTSIADNTGSRRSAGIVVGVRLRLASEEIADMIILKGSLSLASINKELRKLDMEPVVTVSAPVKASVSDVISDQQPSGDAQPSAGAKSPAEVSSDDERESSNWDTVLAVIITFSLTAVLAGVVFVWRGRGSCNPSKVTAHPVVQSVPLELPNPVEFRENDF